MFGYVRPLKGELKVSEYESFKAVYCGLCHMLGRRYGLPARFVLNYDLAFFAAILSAVEGDQRFEHRRCIASPFKKKCVTCGAPSSELAADVTVLLTYLKLDDEARDRKGIGSIPPKLLKLLMMPFYRRARRFRPELSQRMESSIRLLSELESAGSASMDQTADTFAAILSDAAGESLADDNTKRILRSFFYHIGRWIYIVDACDDFDRDREKKAYNPIAYRYGLFEGPLPEAIKAEIKTTLSHSLAAAASAFELMSLGRWEGFAENVIYRGLDAVTSEVLGGTWQRRSKTNERPI